MKNIKNKLVVCILALVAFSSCDPRIEIDESQWGNNSELINVLLFVYEFEDHELQEFRETGELTPGVRKVVRSTNLTIDLVNGTATVDLAEGFSLVDDVVVLAVEHNGTNVVPMNNAPIMGLPADLTTGPYTYRINSLDGNFTDWTITINQL